MKSFGPDDKVHSGGKIAVVAAALADEGSTLDDALRAVHLSSAALNSPTTRVSLNQILWSFREAMERAGDPYFAFRAGLRMHVSTFGLPGFAILTSTNFRRTIKIAARYHNLFAPLTRVEFREEARSGVWTLTPEPHPLIDAALYRFLTEMQFGIHLSLHRDVMGRDFSPNALSVTYAAAASERHYEEVFGCKMNFTQPHNELFFDAAWLDKAPSLGDGLTHAATVAMCEELMREFESRTGLSGAVRQELLAHLCSPEPTVEIARRLGKSSRTLRRKLELEGLSVQKLRDELRLQLAIEYLRDHEMTVDEISDALGFDEASNFRKAFVRWTHMSPQQFKRWTHGAGAAKP